MGLSTIRRILVCSLVLTAAAACTTGSGPSGDDWSRDYVSTFDRVYEAAVESLDGIGFYLESEDQEEGRIRARSSARRAGLDATLLVDVRHRGDRIRVDVMAQSPGLEEGRAPVQVSGLVRDFFHGLDARLEGRVD
jgi:hypothetical protein